jgi:hypothetical protein
VTVFASRVLRGLRYISGSERELEARVAMRIILLSPVGKESVTRVIAQHPRLLSAVVRW